MFPVFLKNTIPSEIYIINKIQFWDKFVVQLKFFWVFEFTKTEIDFFTISVVLSQEIVLIRSKLFKVFLETSTVLSLKEGLVLNGNFCLI